MKTYKIAVLAGDGVGPEVMTCATSVLDAVAKIRNYQFEYQDALIGHCAIEATGEPLPDATLDICKKSDAILLGAVGDPSYDNNPKLTVRPEQGLLKIRKSLGLYANIRPVKIFKALASASSLKPEILEGTDILFFRELTGGIYFGDRKRSEDGMEAIDTMCYDKTEVERIARKAFDAAMTRNKKVHSIDKANVLESSRLWREVAQEVAKDYPEVELVHMFVDNAAMQLIKNPKQFDVVLTGNMFGDILTDEASQISGSLGMLPSASVGNEVGLFEPIHGSAPDIAGKNIVNPLAMILSVALMLDSSFGDKTGHDIIVNAVHQLLDEGYRTMDIADENTKSDKVLTTKKITDKLIRTIEELKPVTSSSLSI